MTKKATRYAGLAAMILVGIMSAANAVSAQDIRLSARKNKIINGFEAQLRGDYRADPNPIRLNAQLENINLPTGTRVAFCLLQNGVKTKIGVGKVSFIGGILVAEVELATNDGQFVPVVNAGDVLQARQSALAPFLTSPGCGAPLLITASFQ